MILSKMILRSLLAIIGILILMGCSAGLPSPAGPTHAPSGTPVPIPSVMPTRVPTPTTAPSPTFPPTEPQMPVRVTGISFSDPSHGWIFGNRGTDRSMTVALAYTIDGGKTWQPLPVPPNLDPPYEFQIASQTRGAIYFVNSTDGWLFYRRLYSTRDGGLTWTQEPVDGIVTEMGRAADGTVWALEKHYDDWSVKEVAVAPYREWRELIPDVITLMDGMRLTLADAKHAWVSYRGPEQRGLMATEDGGATWYSLNSPCDYGDIGIVAVGPRTLWSACGAGGAGPWGDKLVVISADGGRTWAVKGWTPMSPPYDGATMSAYGYFMGEFGALSTSFAYMTLGRTSGLLMTRDGGTTWDYPILGYAEESFQALFIDAQHGWAFGQTSIHRTVDGGKTWACTELPENKPCPD